MISSTPFMGCGTTGFCFLHCSGDKFEDRNHWSHDCNNEWVCLVCPDRGGGQW